MVRYWFPCEAPKGVPRAPDAGEGVIVDGKLKKDTWQYFIFSTAYSGSFNNFGFGGRYSRDLHPYER